MVAREMKYNLKSSASRKIISICQEKAMLKRLHRGWSGFPEQLDIIDCVRNYFLMQKMIFPSMPNTYFRVAQISWNDHLSVN